MKLSRCGLAVLALFSVAGAAQANSFLNGGFEDGNLGSWTSGGGNRTSSTNQNLTAARLLPGGDLNQPSQSGQVSVVTPGDDPNVGAVLNRVFAGTYSARIGDAVDGGFAGAIRQQVANYGATTLNFSWAAVLEPAHGASDAPIFNVRVVDVTNANNVVYNVTFAAFPGAPTQSLFQAERGFVYAPWQSVSINTTVGNTYAIELFAADCSPTAHLGYAYLDGFGSVAGGSGDNGQVGGGGQVPLPGTLALLGIGLAGAAIRRRKA
jgi:hypothetical protein